MKEAEASGRMALAQKLDDQMRKLEEQAAAFSIPNEFGATLSQAGGVGLNATTSHDATRYFMALPANKLELWFALEAETFRVAAPHLLLHALCADLTYEALQQLTCCLRQQRCITFSVP